jgi:hypothetical protein
MRHCSDDDNDSDHDERERPMPDESECDDQMPRQRRRKRASVAQSDTDSDDGISQDGVLYLEGEPDWAAVERAGFDVNKLKRERDELYRALLQARGACIG